MKLELNNVEKIFRQKIADALPVNTALNVDSAFQLVLDFFNHNKIDSIDNSDPDYDMLLFQYSISNLQDEQSKNFSLDFTRQFYKTDEEENEIYQLSFTLYFDKADFNEVGDFTEWSEEFSTLEEWINVVKETKGFKQAKKSEVKFYEINFCLT